MSVYILAFTAVSGLVPSFILFHFQSRRLKETRRAKARLKNASSNLSLRVLRIQYAPNGRRTVLWTGPDYLVDGRVDEASRRPIPEDWSRNFHPDDRVLVFEKVPAQLRATGQVTFQIRVPAGEGQWLWSRVSETVVERLEDGGLITLVVATDIDEDMRDTLTAEESERRFRDLVHMLPVGVIAIDRDDKIVIYNEAAVKIWGRRPRLCSPERFKGSWTYPDGTSLGHEADANEELDWVLNAEGNPLAANERPLLRSLYGETFPGGREVRFRQPDGTMIDVMAYTAAFHDRKGGISGAVRVLLDVSEAKKVEEELRSRERETRLIMENTSDSIVRYDREARRVFVNHTKKDYRALVEGRPVGYKPSETGLLVQRKGKGSLSPVSFRSLSSEEAGPPKSENASHMDIARQYEAAILQVARDGLRSEYEAIWRVDESGERVVSHLRFSPEFDEGGHVVSVLATGRDITQYKVMEERLALREHEFHTLAENAPFLIVRYDNTLARIFVNKAWRDLSGISLEAALLPSSRYSRDRHGSLVKSYFKALKRVLDTGTLEVVDFQWETPGGARLHLEYTIVPERGTDGRIFGLLAMGRDITESKRLEEERRRLETSRQAVRSLEMLGRLAGGIAHDFNNLLGAILGFAGFIAEDAEEGGANATYANRILSAGRHGRALIGQIMSFSKSNLDTRQTCFSLREVLNEILDIVEVSVPSSTRLLIDDHEARCVVRGNHGQIAQAILNLVGNANHALNEMPGDVSITITRPDLPASVRRELAMEASTETRCWRESDGTVWSVQGSLDPSRPSVALVVADTGIGLDLAQMELIFKPFYSTKSAGMGTGLGLVVVQNVIQSHNGGLVMSSRPGRGSEVTIILPTEADELDAANESDESGTESSRHLSGRRILLAEDDDALREMLTLALERKGGQVEAVSCGTEALSVLRENERGWDILISDQTMPGMRGIELISAAKALCPELPCILYTGYAGGIGQEECDASGVDVLLRKPLDNEALLRVILRLLKGTMA